MYKIKMLPEDFIVKEIYSLDFKPGKYSILELTKIKYNTLQALELISKKLNISLNDIGFCGNKDRNAITTQLISIKNLNLDKLKSLESDNLKFKFISYHNEALHLGSHMGNEFTIVVRNLDSFKINDQNLNIPNYFGPQRFGTINVDVGLAILSKDFKSALNLLQDTPYKNRINFQLKKNPSDYLGALKKVPFNVLRLFIHSVQSKIFNESLERILKLEHLPKTLKLLGFGTDLLNNPVDNIIKDVLSYYKLNSRSFILPFFPGLSSEGGERNIFINMNNFVILDKSDDDLNLNKKIIKLKFELDKSSYATIVIEYLFHD